MSFTPTQIPDVILVEPNVFRDDRGFFLETFHVDRYREGGIGLPFVQDNHSRSVARTLRGLHAQRQRPQGKLVRAVEGEIWDVAVDIRRGSPTFKQWVGVTLSADNFRQLYVPPGFAHGFCVLSETAQVEYKCTDLYDATDELGLRWDDPEIDIAWPIADPLLSKKDAAAPTVSEAFDRLPLFGE
ncbi:MAG: dTDP-4-dehydrorhamnose 3,5-epimerase [Thermoanaerobaculia bacterium]|nr:dTDP-4-dehydrorhamnose 3,5-epimerase [Thermoanaerobaculia bacterium]